MQFPLVKCDIPFSGYFELDPWPKLKKQTRKSVKPMDAPQIWQQFHLGGIKLNKGQMVKTKLMLELRTSAPYFYVLEVTYTSRLKRFDKMIFELCSEHNL